MVTSLGLLFPGQGAQYVGMGGEWAEQFPEARRVYEEGDQILKTSLSRVCFEGPEETLTRTVNAQPAIFVTSLALLAVLERRVDGFRARFAAGLSLGEFSALVAAGSLAFADGLRLVKARAELMESAAQRHRGTMVSILGLNQGECQSVAKESGAELANLNAPDQFVLSGSEEAIQRAATLAEGMGAKRVIRLKVSGAFHSSLMEEAREGLEQELRKVTLQAPRCLFIPNVSAKGERDPEKIRVLLGEQLTSPVRWVETMEEARKQGIGRFVELGPGRVLKGLTKRIDPSLEVFSFDKISDLSHLEVVSGQA